MNNQNTETKDDSYEEIFLGHEINIDLNPDHYRGGFSWSISKDSIELDCGLSLTLSHALIEARDEVNKLTKNEN